jgi:hypothetical protein
MAYSNLAQLRMLASTQRTIHWGQMATDLAERLDRTDILVHALNNVGTVEFFVARDSGRAKLTRSLTVAKAENLEEHVARAYNNLANNLVVARDLDEADGWIAEGLTYCTERDLDSWRLTLLSTRARSELERGHWAAAAAGSDEVLRDPRASPISRFGALVVSGRVRARRGEAGVWPVLEEALTLANATGELPKRVTVAVALAEAAWLGGDPDRARAVVEETLASLPLEDDGGGGHRESALSWRLVGRRRAGRRARAFAQTAGEGLRRRWRASYPYEAPARSRKWSGYRPTRSAGGIATARRPPSAAAVSRREMGA